MTPTPANASLHLATPQDAARINDRLVEAARYALLRRLGPAMRHDIAGALQPLGMVAAVLDKRLQQPQPDIAALVKSSSAIGKLLREASSVCMELTSWLAPKEDETLSASDGVDQSVKLLSTSLMLRGFSIDIAGTPVHAMLDAGALRQVFSICLVALTDAAPAPASVVVTLEALETDVLILIQIKPAAGDAPGAALTDYRPLEWDDVQLMAAAEGVGLHRLADGAELRLAHQSQ